MHLASIEIAMETVPSQHVEAWALAMAKASLDWQPTVELEEGLALTIEHFRKVVAVP